MEPGTFSIKKAPKGALSFIRMGCHRRTALTDSAAAAVAVVDAVVVVPDFAAVLDRAG